MWMGGNVPLGYDPPTGAERALVVNDAEAVTVRSIFSAYLEIGSVHVLQRVLAERGIQPKQRTTRAGRTIGGKGFSRGALFHLFRNRVYVGEIVHKGTAHPGLHPAIVAADLFDAVQAKLDANARRHAAGSDQTAQAHLAGRIFDSDGQPMSPTFTRGKNRQAYRYYVSAPLQQGRAQSNDTAIQRIAGPALEALVSTSLRRLAPRVSEPLLLPERVEVHADNLQLLLPISLLATVRARLADNEIAEGDAAVPTLLRLTLPIRMRLRGGRTWILGATKPASRRDPILIKALCKAHTMLQTDDAGLPTLTTAPPSPYLRRILRLAFLAPDLQRAILDGRQPPGLTLEQLTRAPIPHIWSEQATLFDR